MHQMLASNYEDTLDQYQNLAVAIVIDDKMQDYIKSSQAVDENYEQKANILYDFFLNMINVQGNMNFAAAVKEGSGDYVYKGNSSVTDSRFDEVYRQDYEASTRTKPGSAVKMSFGDNYFRDKDCTLTLYHPIYSTSAIGTPLGMLVLNLNDSLVEEIRREDADGRSKRILVDQEGTRLAAADKETIGDRVSYAHKLKGSSGSFWENGNLVNYQKIGQWGFYLVSEIPLAELYRNGSAVVLLLVLIVLVVTFFAVLIVRKMMDSFYEPINRVVKVMDDVVKGQLDVRIDKKRMDVDSRKLAEGFNTMMDEIDRLMEQIKVEQHQIEQIRFEALQSQIKPHFLYNTLECIHWQAVADGNEEISTMVKAMAKYYRICLSRGKEIIPLEQELEHIRSYLIIQNMRYDNIISLEIHIPEQYYKVEIPKLTLQPLVENAIYHGIRVREGKKGTVTLNIREEGNEIYLCIADSGCGMRQEEIDEMNQSISEYKENFGYGVRNVNKRIELLFGRQYGIRFYQGERGGVTVEIHIPKEKTAKNGEEEDV